MVYNYLKVILRYLFRSRFFTSLNVLGLSVGLACCIVIYLFVKNELSYDRFHNDGDNTFRVIRQSQMSSMPYNIGITSGPFAEALQLDYQDRIKDKTRAFVFSSLVEHEDKSFIEDKLMLADKNFFQFFSYPLESGDPASVLADPGSLVITREFSKKYFGEVSPIGKVLRIDNEHDLQVTGVLDDMPGNTHLKFDAVGSIAIIEKEPWYNEWWNNSTNTYVKVTSPEDAEFLRSTFPDFMNKYFGKDFERVGNRIGLNLEPLGDIYFNYTTRYDQNIAHGDKRYVYIFGCIGVMLILLAAINYINLATAQTSQRAKEVGIRKTLGSTRASIATQFLSESFLLSLISLLIGLCIAQAVIPYFNSSFGISIPGIFSDQYLVFFLLALLVIISLLAGGYPSFLLSSIAPMRVMKREMKNEIQFILMRKALVVFQFCISVFMIIATLFISRQLEFMREKDLGFSPEKVVLVRMNNPTIRDKRQAFKDDILRQTAFESVSLASGHPGGFYDASTVTIEGQEERLRMRTLFADEGLTKTMNIELSAGRFFSKEFPGDSSSSVVLNETAVRQLGWTNEDAIGKRVMLAQFDSVYKEVIGVVKDYHFTSLKEQIEPMIIGNDRYGSDLLIRLAGNDLQQAVASIQKLWDTYDTGFPMELSFLDETLSRLYTNERVQGKMFSIFSIICLGIASLGILGLASFVAAQRKKEIGIRKVLGATVNQLSILLMKDLLLLVLVANAIAVPLGYWAIHEWSQGFAYRVPLSAGIFVGGTVVVLLFALLIVGFNASKTAMENPIKSLRSE